MLPINVYTLRQIIPVVSKQFYESLPCGLEYTWRENLV